MRRRGGGEAARLAQQKQMQVRVFPRKLVTNWRVESIDAAIEKLQGWAMRWKIETFHKILKSGCKAEESKLRTWERLANLIPV